MEKNEEAQGRYERMAAEIDAQLIGYHLQQLRLKNGLSQEKAAEKFHYTPKQWARYERGETLLPLALLMTLRNVWVIPSIDEFLFSDDYDPDMAKKRMPRSKNVCGTNM